jgi:hypothetical protein
MIRIGNENHSASLKAVNVLLLDIVESKQHEKYDGASSYYDIAVLTTDTVKINQVNKKGIKRKYLYLFIPC